MNNSCRNNIPAPQLPRNWQINFAPLIAEGDPLVSVHICDAIKDEEALCSMRNKAPGVDDNLAPAWFALAVEAALRRVMRVELKPIKTTQACEYNRIRRDGLLEPFIPVPLADGSMPDENDLPPIVNLHSVSEMNHETVARYLSLYGIIDDDQPISLMDKKNLLLTQIGLFQGYRIE
ncbi:hypothetical protein MIR68_005924 [Amoeboaphelidium protococcarum]|nr:hypothetical protein MIR68_005924 [Amoeboaphelidium protococcarum]